MTKYTKENGNSCHTSQNYKNNNKIIMFSEIKSYVKKDILEDIKLILNSIKKGRLKKSNNS